MGMMTFIWGHPSVAILQSDDVVDFGRGDFEQVARDDGLELMDLFGEMCRSRSVHSALDQVYRRPGRAGG